MKPKIVMLDKDNEKKEIEIEIEYLSSLTTAQRFKMVTEYSKWLTKILRKHDRRKTPEIFQRK